MLLLTFRDLVYRRTRFLVVVVLGAVVFALLFVMTGLVEQFNTEPFDAVEVIGADTWVVPDGISGRSRRCPPRRSPPWMPWWRRTRRRWSRRGRM
jgi:hypothetical protein